MKREQEEKSNFSQFTRHNSTIPIYKGVCSVCVDDNNDSSEKILATKNGICKYHYQKAKALERKFNGAKKTSKGLFNSSKTKETFEESMASWYEEKMTILDRNPYCFECALLGKQTFIPIQFRLHAIAHIFPKKQFPSVKKHALNYLFLAAGCGHHEMSHVIDKFSKMRCFGTAIDRFLIFRDKITEHHKYLSLFENAAKEYEKKNMEKY